MCRSSVESRRCSSSTCSTLQSLDLAYCVYLHGSPFYDDLHASRAAPMLLSCSDKRAAKEDYLMCSSDPKDNVQCSFGMTSMSARSLGLQKPQNCTLLTG